jgi:hypothetical protein
MKSGGAGGATPYSLSIIPKHAMAGGDVFFNDGTSNHSLCPDFPTNSCPLVLTKWAGVVTCGTIILNDKISNVFDGKFNNPNHQIQANKGRANKALKGLSMLS